MNAIYDYRKPPRGYKIASFSGSLSGAHKGFAVVTPEDKKLGGRHQYQEQAINHAWEHFKGVLLNSDIVTITIRNCARCGGDHELPFKPFAHAPTDFTHWATCPATLEPVLMVMEST